MREALFAGLPLRYQILGVIDGGIIAFLVLRLALDAAVVASAAARRRWRAWRVQQELVQPARPRLDARDPAPASVARMPELRREERGVDGVLRCASRDPVLGRDVYAGERRAELHAVQQHRRSA